MVKKNEEKKLFILFFVFSSIVWVQSVSGKPKTWRQVQMTCNTWNNTIKSNRKTKCDSKWSTSTTIYTVICWSWNTWNKKKSMQFASSGKNEKKNCVYLYDELSLSFLYNICIFTYMQIIHVKLPFIPNPNWLWIFILHLSFLSEWSKLKVSDIPVGV